MTGGSFFNFLALSLEDIMESNVNPGDKDFLAWSWPHSEEIVEGYQEYLI